MNEKKPPLICYNFASRSRPDKFFLALDNIREKSASNNYFVICSLDSDDPSMNNQAVKDRLRTYNRVHAYYGISYSKVDAINREVEHFGSFDILVNTSDDMRFIKECYDLIIADHMQANFPDGDGMLHFPDGNHAGNVLVTMSIMGKKYFDRDKYIYHPDYASLWCDNEATDVARLRGRYKFIDEQIFEHLHPAYNKAPTDAQYIHTESFFYQDKAVYESRKATNFGL